MSGRRWVRGNLQYSHIPLTRCTLPVTMCTLPMTTCTLPFTHTYSHDRVLEAVTVNGELCGINRFEPVLAALKKTNNPMLQLACLQFINAIVNTPDDIDFKIHLRNEFMRGGLEDVLVVSGCYNKASACNSKSLHCVFNS